MKTFKGLWILLAVVVCSSVAFGSIPSTFAPQQAVVDTVLLVIDGAPKPKTRVAAAASNGPSSVPSMEQDEKHAAATDTEAETARLAQYVALHKGQSIVR